MDTLLPGSALTPRAFWFLRHGETDWNARGVSQGNVDTPLNATGVAQAEAAALLLRNRGIRTVVSSPLNRARHTAGIVAEALGLPVAVEPELREVSFGVQEGQPMGDWFHNWTEGRFTPEGAETFAELRGRATRAVNRALGEPAPVLVVAHGAFFRALRSAMGLSRHERTPNAAPFFCEPGPQEPGLPWTLTAYG